MKLIRIMLAASAMSAIFCPSWSKAALWSPSDLTNDVLTLWVDASDVSTITTNASGQVQLWQDKSTNNLDLSQGNGTYKPTWAADGFDGGTKPSISFNQQSMAQQGVSGMSTGDWTLVFVIDDQSTDAEDWIFVTYNGSPGEQRFMLGTNGPRWTGSGGSLPAAPYASGEQVLLWSMTNSPSIYRNGSNILTSAIAYVPHTINVGQDLCLGGRRSSNPGPGIQAEVCEFVLIFGGVDEKTRERLEGYLAWKWGLVDELVAGHRYKNGPPYNTPRGTIVRIN